MKKLASIVFFISIVTRVLAGDSTAAKPKRFFIDVNGGKMGLYISELTIKTYDYGPNPTYKLRGDYFFQGNFFYQPRLNGAILGYDLFCGLGYNLNKLTLSHGLYYSNYNKFTEYSYSTSNINHTILNHNISFCVGLKKTRKAISVSHRFGCIYSFASNKNFTSSYVLHEKGSYSSANWTWVSYEKDHPQKDEFTFRDNICPYYGFDISFGKKLIRPHLGFETVYYSNDIIVRSLTNNISNYAFDRALMAKLYVGLIFAL